jgi:transposase
MSIVGGFDVHRKQITFDYVDTDTGRLERGQIRPADRSHLAGWLAQRFAGEVEVDFAVEGCTGWRYVVEELVQAGCRAHLADPAETATARGRKRRAKTDRADAKLQRELLVDGRLPECWIPPAHILDLRALLETYHELREAHTGWLQRIHAVLFHQGAPSLAGSLHTDAGQAQLAEIAAGQLSPVGQVQVTVALEMITAIEVHLDALRGRIHAAARRLHGARVLAEQIYGVGPVTALALTCWLGGADRFSSSRKAVRFAGLDVTVYSSDGKRAPGHLSRQGPGVLRWAVYEAGKTHARGSAPDYAYYTRVKERIDGKRAAISEARKIIRKAVHILTPLGDQALATT